MTDAVQAELKRLVSGTALAFGGAVLGNGLVYVLGLVIARLLGPEAVGFYFLGLLTMQLASACCRLGLAEGILRYVAVNVGVGDMARARQTIFSAITVAGVTSVLVGALVFVLSDFLSVTVFKQPGLEPYLKWFAAALPVFTVFVLLVNATQAFGRMDLVVTVRDILQPVVMTALALSFIAVSRTPSSFLAAHFISLAIALLVALRFVHKCGADLAETRDRLGGWRPLLAFSIPIGIGDLINYVFRWFDTFFLTLTRSASEVGTYNAALRTTLLLNVLASSVNALYAPMVASHHNQERHAEIQEILRIFVRWCMMLTLPIVFSMAFLSDQILGLWGAEFQEGSTTLAILAVGQLAGLLSSLLAFTLLMSGKQVIEVMNTAAVTAVNISLNLVLIPKFGVEGAATSMFVSQCVGFLLRVAEVRYSLDTKSFDWKIVKPIVALVPVSLGAVLLWTPLLELGDVVFGGSQLAILTAGFALIVGGYTAALYFLGFEEEDMTLWKEIKGRRAEVSHAGG